MFAKSREGNLFTFMQSQAEKRVANVESRKSWPRNDKKKERNKVEYTERQAQGFSYDK